MGKLFITATLVLLLIACRQQEPKAKIAAVSEYGLVMDSIPKRVTINTKAMAILNAWPEFSTLESSFDALYMAENREDLILIVEDFVEKQKVLEASEYPEEFDKAQIKSRQKVLKTYILKLKAALEYRSDVYEPMSEMITAYNALRTQFNVTVNNTLNTKLLLDK
jgi:hypothetical protein